MKPTLLLILSFWLTNTFSQQEAYFQKIQALSFKTRSCQQLIKQVDSIKLTRRPNDSYVRLFFDRDVDFNYTHKRILIVFNGICRYQLNILARNDTICLSSLTFGDEIGTVNDYYEHQNKKHSIPNIDTVKAIHYLWLRNKFYSSKKTLKDLKGDLDLNEIYALRGGDGYNETQYKKRLDILVKKRDFKSLNKLLQSINCETQTYAVTAFDTLNKRNITIPDISRKLVDHIKNRNSDIEILMGDIGPFIRKEFK